MLCAAVDGVGDSRSRSVGMMLDSAPVVETLPISSWLNKAMTLTLPLSLRDGAYCVMASTAQKLEDVKSPVMISKGSGLTMTQGCPCED